MEMNMAKFSEKLQELVELGKKKKNVYHGAPVTDGDPAMPVAWNCNDTLFRVEHAQGNAKDYVGRNACNGLCSLRDV